METGEITDGGIDLQPSAFSAGVLDLIGVDPEPFYPGEGVFYAMRA
jgi:hypothetical protein